MESKSSVLRLDVVFPCDVVYLRSGLGVQYCMVGSLVQRGAWKTLSAKESPGCYLGNWQRLENTVSLFYSQNQKLLEAVKTFVSFLPDRILLRK